ncbi:myricetin 3'-O-methyltransferase 4 isoform X2 [Arachis hypogaea]|uniref:myricetin 3'-O-methyltransferase 4 isoform X2 n=2 Tax=Arachis hypogaea TaxID=3818 RepID=UPI000DECD6E2|nr:uncharacterized protein LOC112742426 isoform X2 [Arachis hypogaea]
MGFFICAQKVLVISAQKGKGMQFQSRILTTLCDHSFQCPCVSKWTYLSCPILDEYNRLLTSQLETQRQNILHDSDDEECLKILKNCWKAIHRMMGVHKVLPAVPEQTDVAKMTFRSDVFMMFQTPKGKERTYQDL